jgi:SAM-dependent methyltransferase
MNKHTELKKEEWLGKIAEQRTKSRTNYPGAPSASPNTVVRYEELFLKAIGGKENPKVMVLGATPELRDLALKHGAQLATIDISKEMVEKCTKLMKYKNNPNEKVVMGDWLKTGFSDENFDVIMGDGVANNISYNDHEPFFRELGRILKTGGYLIEREGIKNMKLPRRKVEEINQDYLDGKFHWFDCFLGLYFHSVLTEKCQNDETGKSEMTKFWALFAQEHKAGRISQKLFDEMWWFKGNIVHTFLPEEKLIAFMEKYFTLLPVTQVGDFPMMEKVFHFFFGQKK